MFSKTRNSWALIKASAGVLRADKELIVFPILSGLVGLVVLVSFLVPTFLSGLFESLLGGRLGGIAFLVGVAFYSV